MRTLLTTVVASLTSCLATGALLRSEPEVLRAERIEIGRPGEHPSIVLDATEDGGVIRMRAASDKGGEARPWSLVLYAGTVRRPSISLSGAVYDTEPLLELGLIGEPEHAFIRVGREKSPQFVIQGRNDERKDAPYRSVLVRSVDGKVLLRD